MSTPFDNADVYDASNQDRLCHETPEEAVVERVDMLLEPRTEATYEQQVLAIGEIEVTAFNRETITSQFVNLLVDRLTEQVSESWAEDYGDYEDTDSLPVEAMLEFSEAIRPHVLTLLESKQVFRCLQVGSRLYKPQEVLAIVKEAQS